MSSEEKFDYIAYVSYRFRKKHYDSKETKEFFDLELSKMLYEDVFSIGNSIRDLLDFFDFSDIFASYNYGLKDIQVYLLKFMIMKDVSGIDSLLKNMPYELKGKVLYDFYKEIKSRDDRAFWISNIIKCLSDQEKLQFIHSVVNELSDDEIIGLIKTFYLDKNDILLSVLLNNERFANVSIDGINPPFFYEMLDELKSFNDLKDRRVDKLKNMIVNYQDYDIDFIKNVYCDLYFNDLPKNVMLDIKTILDLANDDETYKNSIGNLYDGFYAIYNFLDNDKDYTDENIQLLFSDYINKDVLSNCYKMAQERFQDLVSTSINKKVTDNIKPTILTSSNGKEVKMYKVEKQTPFQEHFTMLVSTIPCAKDAKMFKQFYDSDKNGELVKGRRSCSLVNESKLTSLFGGDGRITLGYNDLEGRVITCATYGDASTDGNEFRFRRQRKPRQNNFVSIDNFISNTQCHTEITVNMGSTGEIMKPSYILITNPNPSQFEIDVASEFGIPIRYVNIDCYEQKPNLTHLTKDYDYYFFEKPKNNRIRTNIKTI